MTEKDIELQNGGPGVYSIDLTKHHLLKVDEWRADVMPEIMNGKNIADFVDPDIIARLDELEREEEQILEDIAGQMEDSDSDLDEDEKELIGDIRKARGIVVKVG